MPNELVPGAGHLVRMVHWNKLIGVSGIGGGARGQRPASYTLRTAFGGDVDGGGGKNAHAAKVNIIESDLVEQTAVPVSLAHIGDVALFYGVVLWVWLNSTDRYPPVPGS